MGLLADFLPAVTVTQAEVPALLRAPRSSRFGELLLEALGFVV